MSPELSCLPWKIDQTGEGVLGFITNHSYLDNPTFRGMRQSLMTTFDEMHILDLHGNSLKKEKCPDGSKDVNVFDIQQGVAIALFVKKRGKKKAVLHADLGGRENQNIHGFRIMILIQQNGKALTLSLTFICSDR